MPSWTTRRGDVRTVGLIAAAGLTVAFGTVVAWFAMKPPGPKTALPTPATKLLPPPPPDVKATTGESGLGKVNRLGAGSGFFFTFVDKADPTKVVGEINAKRSEPLENKRYKLEEPRAWMLMRQGRWAFIQAARGRAFMPDEGANARPQQAILEGDVIVKLFAPNADGSRPKETDNPILIGRTPTMEYDGTLGQVVFPEKLTIDSGQVTFKGSGVTVLMNDADQRLEAMTIEHTDLLEINPKAKPLFESADVSPAAPAPTTSPRVARSKARSSPALGLITPSIDPPKPASPAPAAPTNVESLYSIRAHDNVSVEQAGRRITADRVDGWLRLVDNRLRPNAVSGLDNAPEETTPPPAPSIAQATDVTPVTITHAPHSSPAILSVQQTTQPAPDDIIRLHWTGRAEVRPLEKPTDELARDDVYVRFLANHSGQGDGTAPSVVRVTDTGAKAQITGDLVEYAATTRRAAVSAEGTRQARLESGNSGLAMGKRFEVDLTHGTVTSTGPGELTSKPKDTAATSAPSTQSSLAWTDHAAFTFAMDQGKMSSRLLAASLAGGVRATDGKGVLEGDSMIAEFVPSPPSSTSAPTATSAAANTDSIKPAPGLDAAFASGDAKSWLRSLHVSGNVRAADGKPATGTPDSQGTLAADTLDVEFADAPLPGKDQPDVERILAAGNVRAGRQDTKLEAGTLEAILGRDSGKPDADASVRRVFAGDGVTFRNRDGVTAMADALDADPIAQVALLTGKQPQIRKGDDAVGLTIITSAGDPNTPGSIRLVDADRSMTIEGPGSFSHTQPGNADRAGMHVVANWSDRLTYSDLSGEAVCTGKANIEIATDAGNSPNALSGKDVAKGEQIRLAITPADRSSSSIVSATSTTAPAQPAASPDAAKPLIPNDRRFLRAEAYATIPGTPESTTDTPKLASLEVRRYAAPTTDTTNAEPVLQRLLYLESATILADNDTGVIQTPGPGKLITLDRTPDDKQPTTDAARTGLLSNTSVRGSSLFAWKGSMKVDRPTGVATLSGGSRMVHDPLPAAANEAPAERTELECQDLSATFRELASTPAAPATTPNDSLRGQLQSVHAQSSVWMRVGQRELVADILDYDAATRRAEAQALGQTPVTLLDRATGSPVSANRLLWDMGNNRIEILKPVVPLLPR